MDKLIDAQFARVEKALATLITSIATYNPSPSLAADLISADASLSSSLSQLAQHQANHARLLSLRSTSAALDAQIRDTLLLLTTTRAELRSTPTTAFDDETYEVKYNDLLRYASRIAKFTRPPNFREGEDEQGGGGGGGAGRNGAGSDAAAAMTPQPGDGDRTAPGSGAQTNGASTPAAGPGVSLSLNGAMVIDRELKDRLGSRAQSESTPAAGDVSEAENATQSKNAEHETALPEAYSKWLDPFSEIPFVPWPTEETIRRGALASIQILVDSGIDPATFDPAQSAALEEERKRREEEEERLREEQRAREEEERRREMERRRGSVMASGRQEEKPKVFMGLDLLDDDDD